MSRVVMGVIWFDKHAGSEHMRTSSHKSEQHARRQFERDHKFAPKVCLRIAFIRPKE